ncbi:MAG: twin-arginine translocation signal domain-containing protein, partial [Planctomycetes bacterium]|nr:twin-arginine translocation signal domain-containing protein [Planctomycetota bacterium]
MTCRRGCRRNLKSCWMLMRSGGPSVHICLERRVERKGDMMRRRDFLKSAAIAGGALSAGFYGTLFGARKKKRPNFLVMLVDDMGYSD